MRSAGVLRGRLVRLAAKELRETLRDRRTVFTLVLMPVLLYPLLSLGFQRFLLMRPPDEPPHFLVGTPPGTDASLVKEILSRGQIVQASEVQRTPARQKPTFDVEPVEDLSAALESGDIDVGLKLLDLRLPISHWELVAPDFGFRTQAEQFVLDCLRTDAQKLLAVRPGNGLAPQSVSPIRIAVTAVRAGRARGGVSLAGLVPVVLVLMTITGAVYPAIDLTAGERERNTLELLVAAPVPRLELLLAKYAAVATVAFLTAAINLISMTVTLQATGMGPEVWGEGGLSLVSALLVFALLGLFAAFFSAVLLCITSFARSFKEAQAYLVPLMLVSISPGLAALLPHVRLTNVMSVVPLLNVVLLARDLLAGRADVEHAAAVVCTTLLYGAAALGLASRIFGADAVLYDARAGWSELLERPARTRAAPALPAAMLCLALLFPATFLVAGLVGQWQALGIDRRLLVNSLYAAAIFAGVPTVSALWQRVRFLSGFFLRPPPVLGLPAAVVLGLSLWVFAYELSVLSQQAGLVTLTPEQQERARGIAGQLRQLPLSVVLLSLAIVPAVTEEWLFRGFVFSALSSRMKPWAAIVGSGALFGVFHLIATDALAVERLLPSTLLGCALAFVCWKTNSIFPGMVLHAVHNGLLVSLAYFEPALSKVPWMPRILFQPNASGHLPWEWLLTAAAGAGFGFLLLHFARRAP